MAIEKSTGWVDPATGQSTPVGVGEPLSSYQAQNKGQTTPAPQSSPAPVSSSNQTTPAINPSISTTTPKNAAGELIDPTKQDVSDFNQKFDTTTPAPAPAPAAKIEPTTSTGVFTEEDAQKYALSMGDSNWQKYVGGVGGQTNPMYIGATNWATLQKNYTPYQLQQATIRTNNGIYWNPNVNIAELPKSDPTQQINNDAATIAKLVSDAKTTADPYTKKTEEKAEDAAKVDVNVDNTMAMLQGLYGDTSEDLYNELFNTEEIKQAKADVIDYKTKLDEYDDQLDELKNDIRKEVEGEAPESYISALATVRGGNILKLQKQSQRSYETALAVLTNARTEANALLQIKMNDSNNRYNRMFQMLQLQIQQEGTAFNQQMALLSAAQQIPEGRSIQLPDGSTIKGMKENDNLNVVQFTDANRKTYVIGVDKKTGEELYRTYIGNAPSSGGSSDTFVKQLAEYQAEQELKYQQEINDLMGKGEVDIAYDEKGNAFYYDKKALEDFNSNKKWFTGKKEPIDYRL